MTRTPLINVDAEWLMTLGETYIADEDFETGMRLTQIAARLEKLDAAMMHFQSSSEFDRGVREAYARIYERSNLPEEERSVKKEMAEALGRTTVQPRRMTPEPKVRVAPELAGVVIRLNPGMRRQS